MHVLDLDAFLLESDVFLFLLDWIEKFDAFVFHEVAKSLLRFRLHLLVIDFVLASALDNSGFGLELEGHFAVGLG